nr:MAG TPA: hypothetical protein [Caudoviricetes sp.]
MPDRHRKLLWVLLEDKPYRGGSSAAYFKPTARKFWLTRLTFFIFFLGFSGI